ncbi:MAG: hypothetical protein PHW72_01435 [Candidatus Pacebacteria bacterium]|nr:hypothetical protein [Candidatus Paceibacterota bacterium]
MTISTGERVLAAFRWLPKGNFRRELISFVEGRGRMDEIPEKVTKLGVKYGFAPNEPILSELVMDVEWLIRIHNRDLKDFQKVVELCAQPEDDTLVEEGIECMHRAMHEAHGDLRILNYIFNNRALYLPGFC